VLNVEIDIVELAIIGSGFGGLGAGVMALEQGIDSFVILERASAVGGTWRDNTYPGCACDIPSHLYSFSFAQNPEWSRSYPAQPEIEAYLEHVADRYELRSRIRFNYDVDIVRWIEEQSCWSITSRAGETVFASAVISATGPLSQPATPDIPGLSMFRGTVFHSAKWKHDVPIEGKRVGVVGTGASAIQLVPAIADRVDHLDVFQRTPPWVLPRDDRPAPAWRRHVYKALPFLQRLHRWRIYARQEFLSIAFLGKGKLAAGMTARIKAETKSLIDASFPDPTEAAALVPTFKPGCKRLLISNDWYPALAKPNVEIVTSSIEKIDESGVVTADGVHHPLDVLVLATGFAVTNFPSPLTIFGRSGVDLAEHWKDGASTDFGLTVSGFPNLWFLAGPGTGLGHNSIVFMIQVQLEQIARALTYMRTKSRSTLELRPEVEAASYAELQRRVASTVWASGCSSWYVSETGQVDTIWPGTTTEYWWRARRFHPDRYVTTAGRFGEITPAR
jgi:cation diffusion facilitator CzcD-associated flavoprotein CzcO